MNTFRTLTLIAALCGTAAVAQAAPHRDDYLRRDSATETIDQRQARQEARIRHGLATGALTRHEAHRLLAEQRAIARAEMHAKADGIVTRRERARIDEMQDRASRDIARQMHDHQTAYRR